MSSVVSRLPSRLFGVQASTYTPGSLIVFSRSSLHSFFHFLENSSFSFAFNSWDALVVPFFWRPSGLKQILKPRARNTRFVSSPPPKLLTLRLEANDRISFGGYDSPLSQRANVFPPRGLLSSGARLNSSTA